MSALAGIGLCLLFPEPLAESAPAFPPLLALGTMGVALVSLRRDRLVAAILTVLALAVVQAWLRAEPAPTVLSHFTNFALGLLVVAVVYRHSATESGHLRLATLGAGAAVAGVLVGLSSVDPAALRLLPVRWAGFGPAEMLPGQHGIAVNENTLGLVAVMALALVLGVGAAARARERRGLALGATCFALAAGTIAMLSQSLTIWATVVVVMLAWGGADSRTLVRRLAAGTGLAVAALAVVVYSLAPPPVDGRAIAGAQVTLTGLKVHSPPGPETAPGGALRLVEQDSVGRHGLRTTFQFPPGIVLIQVRVREEERAAVWIGGPRDVARYDLRNGVVDDLGSCTASLVPQPDRWVALRQVVLSGGGSRDVVLYLLERFPDGLAYRGMAGAGMAVVGPELRLPDGVLSQMQLWSMIVRAAACRSVEGRKRVWDAGWQLWRESFWWGGGLDRFRYDYRQRWIPEVDRGSVRPPAHAHNAWLQLGVDVGVVGLLAYSALLIVAVRRAVPAFTRQRAGAVDGVVRGAALAVLAVHLFGLVDAVALGAKVGTLAWGALALVLTQPADAREETRSTLPQAPEL